jgi:hypothetical protein
MAEAMEVCFLASGETLSLDADEFQGTAKLLKQSFAAQLRMQMVLRSWMMRFWLQHHRKYSWWSGGVGVFSTRC